MEKNEYIQNSGRGNRTDRKRGARALSFHELTLGILIGFLVIVAVAGVSLMLKNRQISRRGGQAGIASSMPVGNRMSVFEVAGMDIDGNDCLIPLEDIHSGGPRKDAIPSLTDPDVIDAEDAEYLNPADRVIGVEFDGEARAYPIRILNWHEAVNDTVGNREILVSWCPLCGSALTFDRNIGGEVREFGISGLLHNSNVLLYDRQTLDSKESLWSQMMMKAVCGPAAEEGLTLELISSEMTSWERWVKKHPQTTVLSLDTGHTRAYTGNPYGGYLNNDRLMFPVEWNSGAGNEDLSPKDDVLIVEINDSVKGYPIKRLADAADENGMIMDEVGGASIRLEVQDAAAGAVSVTTQEGNAVPAARAFWFSFRADHPDAEVFQGR